METIELTHWKLNGYYPYVPLLGKSVELGTDLLGILRPMDAEAPCGVHTVLERNGYLEDPYRDCNSLACEWVEHRWWFFVTEAELAALPNHPLILEFDGLDYRCRIFWNGVEVGRAENMYIRYRFDVTEHAKIGTNTVGVLFEGVPHEMGQIGLTEETRTQKARFGYKWDFSTRLVNIGIWKPCRLRERLPHEVDAFYFRPEGEGRAELTLEFAQAVRDCPVSVTLKKDGREVFREERRADGKQAAFAIAVDCPQLWYPNGAGEQPLYDLRIETGEAERFVKTAQVGFKTIALMQNEPAEDGRLPYVFVVNGRKTYVKGVNMTPLDLRYGDVPRERYERILSALREMNVNLIRVWGGGLIETEWFYELCDRYGLMVWQEFIQSSSGINNVPSKRPEFLEKLYETAEDATREKRNHVCLCVWSGGNELRDAQDVPCTMADENIAGLYEIVRRNSPHVPMLPTSASGPQEMADPNTPGRNHDVHGPWQYLGERAHYDFYNRLDSCLHSEFGVDGMTALESLRRFVSEQSLTAGTIEDNLVYRHHGEWWETARRDNAVFGPPADLREKIRRSQFIQAEGLRYAVEANRRRAFQNSGSIVWQANEPFPNVSCTSLIDYYGRQKPACDALRKAFAPLNVSVKYDWLVWEPGDRFAAEVFVVCDREPEDIVWAAEARVDGVPFSRAQGRTTVGDGRCAFVATLSFAVPEGRHIAVRLTAERGAEPFENEVLLFIRGEDGFAKL